MGVGAGLYVYVVVVNVHVRYLISWWVLVAITYANFKRPKLKARKAESWACFLWGGGLGEASPSPPARGLVVSSLTDSCILNNGLLLWPPNRAGHYMLPLWFLLSFCLRLSSTILSGRRLDVYHASTHDRGLSENLECRSEMCCTRLAENTERKNSPSGHHRTTLSGYA